MNIVRITHVVEIVDLLPNGKLYYKQSKEFDCHYAANRLYRKLARRTNVQMIRVIHEEAYGMTYANPEFLFSNFEKFPYYNNRLVYNIKSAPKGVYYAVK